MSKDVLRSILLLIAIYTGVLACNSSLPIWGTMISAFVCGICAGTFVKMDNCKDDE